jgi:acetate kinase
MNILTLNSGSSSLKFGFYSAGPPGIELLHSGEEEASGDISQRDAIRRIAAQLAKAKLPAPDAVGHRVVHGGPHLRRHCPIDARVLQLLQAAIPFAPLHIPASLSIIRYAEAHFPHIPQIACFDTAFHATMPDKARVLPVPKSLQAEGIQRYGFHGLSCESIVRQFGKNLPARLIVAHLGNGASITAIMDGKSVDTSMGMTPAGGVIMGTRSGDLDPGIPIYLMREKKYDADSLETLIDRQSGMAGISGIGGDMRKLRSAAPSNGDARLAIDMFCYSVRKQIAAMIAAMGGVDSIVFTGGIGENDAETRAAICAGLSWIGVAPDAICVMPSRENEEIARHSLVLISPFSSEL